MTRYFLAAIQRGQGRLLTGHCWWQQNRKLSPVRGPSVRCRRDAPGTEGGLGPVGRL